MKTDLEFNHVKQEYSPPEIEVIIFKMEKGFASSAENWDEGEWPDA